jgi:hypothetical protein
VPAGNPGMPHLRAGSSDPKFDSAHRPRQISRGAPVRRV